MIPSNFSLNEVLKHPSLTLEELKQYIINLNLQEILDENERLKAEVYDLEQQIDELNY